MAKLCLNLGCGSTDHKESTDECTWVNIDKSPLVECDQHFDVIEGLPYLDGIIDEIHAGCILEQLTSEQLLFVLNECHRILREGGKLEGYVPSTDPRVLHLDPMDKLFFQEDSFKYFDKDSVYWQRFGRSYNFLPWTNVETKTNSGGIIHFSMQPHKEKVE